MTDRRLTPANGRVAATHLKGIVQAPHFSDGEQHRIVVPWSNLQTDSGNRDRQLLFGDQVTVYEVHAGRAFVQSQKDGYVGYLNSADLGPARAPTHRVTTRASHIYSAPDFKSADRLGLSLGSLLVVQETEGRFARTPQGFVPLQHVAPLDQVENDPASVALRLLGAPYLWGGNTHAGIDCSGLVQAALHFCGHDCAGDSDLQADTVGELLPQGAPVRRNDLLFWKGHVAIALDAQTIVHANVNDMAVATEDLETAIARIQSQGDGPVTAHRRFLEPHA